VHVSLALILPEKQLASCLGKSANRYCHCA
jgi:hypothetical protein